MNRTYTSRSIATTILILFLGVITIGALYRQTFTLQHTVQTNQMSPTLEQGTVAVINLRSLADRTPQRGEIVLAQEAILRVVGLPNEEIAVAEGMLFIRDFALNEPYATGKSQTIVQTLGASEFMLLPDNREGVLPTIVSREEIVGLAVWHTGGVLPLSAVSHYPHPH